MLHHVSVGVHDVARAAKFYDAALGALGYKRVTEFRPMPSAMAKARPRVLDQLPHDQKRSQRWQRHACRLHREAKGRGARNSTRPR